GRPASVRQRILTRGASLSARRHYPTGRALAGGWCVGDPAAGVTRAARDRGDGLPRQPPVRRATLSPLPHPRGGTRRAAGLPAHAAGPPTPRVRPFAGALRQRTPTSCPSR